MYVRATDQFNERAVVPMELPFIPAAGYVFEVTEERFKVLSGDNRFGVAFVEEIKQIQVKKAKKAKKENNKIGVVIPNCNYADWLEKSISSVINQTYKNYEIIFIDDCSTDNSVEIAKSMLKKPHRVIQLKQKRFNGGARNEAFLYLSKDVDYVLCLDSDDWLLHENVLAEINEILKTAPDVLFFGLTEHKGGVDRISFLPEYKDRYEALMGWSGCGKVVKKELIMRQECLYNEGTLKEDKNQHCKICIYMDDFACLPQPYYVWNRDNANSVTTIRDKIMWGTSTIRHYADTMELYLKVKGRDQIIDNFLKQRLETTEREIRSGGDRQF